MKCLTVLLLSFFPLSFVSAQDFKSNFDLFRQEMLTNYQGFRYKINEEYAAFLKEAWKDYNCKPAHPRPIEREIKPVIKQIDEDRNFTLSPKPLPFDDEVVAPPAPVLQPQPIEPIQDNGQGNNVAATISFTFFGTEEVVRFDKRNRPILQKAQEKDISETWKQMASASYDKLLYDCLSLRATLHLCDWAYLQMLKSLSTEVCGNGTNEATLLMAFLYCQSGYKMRLARDAAEHIYMLFASSHYIYDKPYFIIAGEAFYSLEKCPQNLYICDAVFKGEQPMSLLITQEPQFAMNTLQPVTHQSSLYPEIEVTLTCNRNLIDLYSTYPTSQIGENVCSRWAIYANTPLAENIKRQLYPVLQLAIKECDQITAANRLLNFVQTGFQYEYDTKVWGYDRAFFAEETLYYPYCDCEDRSILFTRLVRDLLGLKCILIYYPGHLASAVCFTENVTGDYINLNHQKFIVCDPTYIGAPVGRTMPDMDNAAAKVILLE